MREQTILKALAVSRMIDKCIKHRDAFIKNLKEAPTYYYEDVIVHMENRIAIYNQMITRLERYFQNIITKLQKL